MQQNLNLVLTVKDLPSYSQVQLLKIWDALLSEKSAMADDVSLTTCDFFLQYFSRCFTLDTQAQQDNVRVQFSVSNLLRIEKKQL